MPNMRDCVSTIFQLQIKVSQLLFGRYPSQGKNYSSTGAPSQFLRQIFLRKSKQGMLFQNQPQKLAWSTSNKLAVLVYQFLVLQFPSFLVFSRTLESMQFPRSTLESLNKEYFSRISLRSWLFRKWLGAPVVYQIQFYVARPLGTRAPGIR